MLDVKVFGHSFVRRLAHYAVEHRSLDCGGGLKVKQLFSLTQDVVGSDIVFLDIGTNDISVVEPVVLVDRVLAYASYLTVMAAVRRVIISEMIFQNASQSRYAVREDFNECVVTYNQYLKDAASSFDSVSFWCHRGVWSDWASYLGDGVHFNQEGNRKYYNSVCGAIIAAANVL